MKEIKFTVKTLSNLMIGGNESGFVIGGIDQHTVMDHDKKPYIPGSSFKGVFRKVIRDDSDGDINKIFKNYKDHLIAEAEKADKDPELKVDVQKFKEQLEKGIESDSEYMFGMNGYNQSPQLMFSDLHLTPESTKENNYFSIDAKNSIEEKENEGMVATPRTYKVVRRDLTFTGTIRFRNFDKLGNDKCDVQKYIKRQLEKAFDDGFYRLGNSKSRGYGHIEVKVIEKVGDS